MSNHVRRKVQRAFRMIGPPAEPNETSPVSPPAPPLTPAEPAPPPTLGKRGRPPKGKQAMTAAERKQEQRRQDSIAEILAIPDTHGRLHGERCGEAPRKHGASEIETIINVREGLQHARASKPEGAAPLGDESEIPAAARSERDGGYVRAETSMFDRNAARAYIHDRLNEELNAHKLDDKIAKLVQWAFSLPGWEGNCRMCGYHASSTQAAEGHIWGAYENMLRLQELYNTEKEITGAGDPMIAKFAQERVGEVRRRWADNKHAMVLQKRLKMRTKRRIS